MLVEEGVQFVLVGGLAAVLHGSPLPTVDIDVVPERESDNFERLAAALSGSAQSCEPKLDRSKRRWMQPLSKPCL